MLLALQENGDWELMIGLGKLLGTDDIDKRDLLWSAVSSFSALF